ncbi:Tetratricopeptide repeat 1 [Hyphodiscus hymeniophilus]|uniref:Tetratricopeptide repeat 1 n=1 Tax=Hyphodiscus hymeniophilus TaxID=353542 RepID=A0A9P6VQ08_9HELO|nr:Tetratricopeptide repeat 1 [Hyphodiscus hymeniophilus]
MATKVNGGTNGYGTLHSPGARVISKRFSDIPSAIDIPVQGEDDDQAVEVDLEDLLDDPTELCTLLENEGAARTYWMTVSLAYAKQKKVDHAIEMLIKGGQAMRGGQKEKLSMQSCLCWMYLWKSREAPRVAPEGALVSEAKTKEYYLNLSTSTLNEASRINPAFPPLFLARGVLQLLKASLQPPAKSSNPGAIDAEKAEILRASLKSFEDAIRVSQGRNMMAVLGKSRALFSLGKHADALEGYQEALHKMPDLIDPDPRIGIGCCFWQLGYKEDAKTAWERALEINPDSKIANILLGLFYLDASAHVPTNGPEFIQLYKKAMTEYTQKAFKVDKDLPLTCATFANYFLSRKSFPNVDTLSHKAIQFTDVNAIASDGWYLLAKKEHYTDDYERAADYYRRADEARGGADRGYLPAKFGAAQLSVLKGDFGEAKLRLEKMIQQSKNIEAMILLGTLYAEEVFSSPPSTSKDEKTAEFKKAIGYLENVRTAWKDPKKNLVPDASVLLNLARLYETEQPEKSLQCLQQVEQMQLDQLPQDDKPEDPDEVAAWKNNLRENLPPQLLNNIGCFHYQVEKYDQARDMFQTAMNACTKIGDKQEEMDTDALVTTIGFNLGRTYEAQGLLDEAKNVYEGLLVRHSDYTDVRTRLAYINLRQNPTDDGPKAVTKLYQEFSADLEVRALYGWYLGRAHGRKRPTTVAEDPELRHYKHTLQNYEKHDRYALIGMGNLYLMTAREMRRETEQEKQKRSAQYVRAVEFFDKALQLDPKNAYAAQGIAIALVEDKKDHKTALQIFVKVRETVKDAAVFVNLGHIFAELRQYAKAIEHYEAALAKDRSQDPSILACLGRTWLARGKAEKNLQAFKNALDYSQKALEVSPDQIFFKFNVAFVQIQLATTVYQMPEVQRTLAEVQAAASGLEEAIESLDSIAQHPQTPYPKHDIEQRANMARNTMRRQLERSIQAQKEYEEKNAERINIAKLQREEELKKREAAKKAAEDAERERKLKIAEERAEITKKDRELAESRAEEARAVEAAEMTTDSETGERVKRKKKPRAAGTGGKRKKKNEEGITDDEDSGVEPKRKSRAKSRDGESDDEKRGKKRRRLGKKNPVEKPSKYKSSEIVVESDSEGDDGAAEARQAMDDDVFGDEEHARMDVDAGSDDEAEATPAVKRKSRRAVVSEDEDEDDDAPAAAPQDDSPATANGDASDTPMADSDDE